MRRSSILLSAIALLTLPAALRADDPATRPAALPGKLGLEEKWKGALGRPLTVARVNELLAEDPQGANLVRWGDARHTSLWSALARYAAKDARLAAELRKAQDEKARALLATAGGLDASVLVARRFPWAPSTQRALLDAGEAELRKGNAGLAGNCFRDVLARSDDVGLRARARVGLWLAAAHSPDAAALDEAFRGVDLKAEFPFLGEKVKAGDVLARLKAKPASPVALKGLRRQVLEVPGGTTSARPSTSGEGHFVAGPALLAGFNGDGKKPLWRQTFPLEPGSNLFAPIVPGPFAPAVWGGRVYTRWGVEGVEKGEGRRATTVGVQSDVAAFDARTGRLSWSTSGLPAWKGLCPVNDPAAADGRVYVLAVKKAEQYSPVYLACLDADGGAVLWKRELVSNHTTFADVRRGAGSALASVRVGIIDVAREGNAVTVADGAVYCQTNVGFVARCDARDGLVEWVRSYPQDVRAAATLRRPGSAPTVCGANVVFVARDAGGVLALKREAGELAWYNTEESPRRALGFFSGRLLIENGRGVAALGTADGKAAWRREFDGPVDAALSGGALYVGTRAKLLRLDADSGKTVEEQDWGKGGPMSGLAVEGGALYGLSRGAGGLPELPPPILASAEGVRVVHRLASPFKVDGKADDWDGPATTAWAKGKLLLTHDNKALYLGLRGPAAVERLDLSLTVGRKKHRWAVCVGRDGKASWQGLGSPVPERARAAARREGDALVAELSLPLEAITKPGQNGDWGRAGLELAVHCEGEALARLTDTLHLLGQTRQQEEASLALARAVPELRSSWAALEQAWRVRALKALPGADLYRDYIKRQPRSPEVGQALLRLDQALRRSAKDEPSREVLELAAQVGVDEKVRGWYGKLGGAYLSQWVYLDDRYQTQKLALELHDGGEWRGVTTGSAARPLGKPGSIRIVTINGVRRVYINGVLVGPKTRRPLGAGPSSARTIPMPAHGSWQELRLPLLWLDVHDRPIHGVAFAQTGGSWAYWGPTVLVAGGKKSALIDEKPAGTLTGKWRWQEKVSKDGKKAHATPHPQFKDETVRHAALFDKAARDHLVAYPAPALPPDKLLVLLEAKLPLLPFSTQAVELHERAEQLLKGDVPRKRLRLAILAKATPEDQPAWLERFWLLTERAELVEALAHEAHVTRPVLADYRKRSGRCLLGAWQVIGPFPTAGQKGHSDAYAPETEKIDLRGELAGLNGKCRWKAVEGKAGRIDLAKALGHDRPGVAYCVCWAHSESKQTVLLELSSNCAIQAWVNREKKNEPVINAPANGSAALCRRGAKVELEAGWNEVLVKLDNRGGAWAYLAQFRYASTGRPLEGVRIQATRATEPGSK